MKSKKSTAITLSLCLVLITSSCRANPTDTQSLSSPSGLISSSTESFSQSADLTETSTISMDYISSSETISPSIGSSVVQSALPSSSISPTTQPTFGTPERNIVIPDSVFTKTVKTESVTNMDYQGIQAIYFDSVDYKGKSTKVFAYIGYPKNASVSNKVPAVVLVHGGGGTAYPQWVQEWTARGYAAIAIDTEGHIPTAPCSYTFTNHTDAGPTRTGDFNDVTLPLADQWMYHAVAAAVRANTLLRSDTRIDSTKIGVCGISWGGIVTSIVVGQDNRLAFGIPIYGCGFMNNSEGYFSDVFKYNKTATDLWEPSKWFNQAKMPVLFINDATDKFFSINSTAKSSQAITTSYMTILPYLTHGHEQGWGAQESYSFADAVCKKQPGLIRINEQPTSIKPTISFSIPAGVTVGNVQLVYSQTAYAFDSNYNCEAIWAVKNATVSGTSASAVLPSGTKSFYLNITDNRGLVTSSRLVSLETPAKGDESILLSQKFESQQAFSSSTTTGSFQDSPLKWGCVPGTVSLSLATGGKDGGTDQCLLVSNRNGWGDSARIRFMSTQIRVGRTYRMTVYFKNGDTSKGLYLTPTVSLYGGSSNSSSPYPSTTEFLPQGCDLGRDISANRNGWIKYTSIFTITQNLSAGTIKLTGFGGEVNVAQCDLGYVVMEFLFVTPGGNIPLDTCSFYLDDFTIEDIT